MSKALSELFSLNRHYARSINLERDLDVPESVLGYIVTERSADALKQILIDSPISEQTRAFTLTGVYGTGKSAFAHFLLCLFEPKTAKVRQYALDIARKALSPESYKELESNLPPEGCFQAIATAQREPLAHTIISALTYGAEKFWGKAKSKNAITKKLTELSKEAMSGRQFDGKEILKLVQEVTEAAKTNVVLLIDELGKNLEFASLHQGTEDLYLLQQLAEFKQPQGQHLYLIGLLHQSFADYSYRLASVQRNEWSKIQGRFSDIAFTESPRQMTRLIGEAIDKSRLDKYARIIQRQAEDWHKCLRTEVDDITPELIAATYPLHPLTALALPILCTRYAQNDRSLFTFLASTEPYSFKTYLNEASVEKDQIPTLKLDRVYDYFIESVGMGLASRPQLQKWVEVQNLINDARTLDSDSLKLLKTVGILNLITSTGALRASRHLVTLAMGDSADDRERQTQISQLIDQLLDQKGQLTERKHGDELRIWEGSDFDVEGEISLRIEQERSPLANILSSVFPLKPVVAQRHSYKTGTVRYFERRYLDSIENLSKLNCSSRDYDGLIVYWVDETLPTKVPQQTLDGKPLILIGGATINLVKIAALEYTALKKIQLSSPQLQTDSVARLEVRHRLVHAERLLDETLSQAFDFTQHQNQCWLEGKSDFIDRVTNFKSKLSDICDRVYDQGLILWNELINRRELSSQGVKAMRLLIDAMLNYGDLENLGLLGNGPEVSIYASVLRESGIHRQENDVFGFYPPTAEGIIPVWQAIEDFCLSATKQPTTIDLLYHQLEAPPYGVKRGAIPVLLAAVLLARVDDVSVYKDRTFIPVLGSEHFELLVKHPQRFAVKYFEIFGLRSQVFRELENVLKSPHAKKVSPKLRNSTMLSVVKPLTQFATKLPTYTAKTKRISKEAQAVIQALIKAQEPDELLFSSLPVACGLDAIDADNADDGTTARRFKTKFVQVLYEVQTAYEALLAHSQSLLHDAFGVRGNETKLREDLRVRASYLTGACLERTLKRFTIAAADETAEDKVWLEALLMIVADKPVEAWTDDDVTGFEIKLSDMARRFINLEAMQKDMTASKHSGFDARRITVTRPDGHEVHRMVWIDKEDSDRLEPVLEDILSKAIFQGNDRLKQALIVRLSEEVFSPDIKTVFTGDTLEETERERLVEVNRKRK